MHTPKYPFQLRFPVLTPKQPAAPKAGYDHRQHDVQNNRQDECFPRYMDRRNAQQQGHDGGKGEYHDQVIQRHLRQRKSRMAAAEVAPDKNHGGTRGRREQDQSGDVTIQLLRRQPA